MPQVSTATVALVALLSVLTADAHGTVSKPIPRKLKSAAWCPWCVGEKHPDTNPFGKSYLDTKPSAVCLGTKRGDAPYPLRNFGQKKAIAEEGPATYVAGQTFSSTIYLNADHFGLARWSFCPHSEAETEECFEKNPLTEWTDVHSYWGGSGNNEDDIRRDDQWYPETVPVPDVAPGKYTLRWLWVCKYTNEIFGSCIDVDIVSPGDSTPTSAPIPSPAPTQAPEPEEPEPEPEPEPTLAPAPTPVGTECSKVWKQCGGKTWSGPTCCEEGLKCVDANDYYSQCKPEARSFAEVKPVSRKFSGSFLK